MRDARIKKLAQTGPLLAGSLVQIAKHCGRAGCHCQKGEKHVGWYLTRSVQGKTQTTYVPQDMLDDIVDYAQQALERIGESMGIRRHSATTSSGKMTSAPRMARLLGVTQFLLSVLASRPAVASDTPEVLASDLQEAFGFSERQKALLCHYFAGLERIRDAESLHGDLNPKNLLHSDSYVSFLDGLDQLETGRCDHIWYGFPVEQESRFSHLAEQWRRETELASSVVEMATHPAYQQIIGMGKTAIPYIIRELAKDREHWFWALKAITGEDPVPEKDRGDLQKMTNAWLEWATLNGYEYEGNT